MNLKRVVFTGFVPRPDGDQKHPVAGLQTSTPGRDDYTSMLRIDNGAVWVSDTTAYPLHIVAWYQLDKPVAQVRPLQSASGKRRRKGR
ncbi:MAG: hypothetical protein CL759_06890 [Chloroflexi bacterium]|nr:hypothetical protein [Chloroflexota bacterium]